MGHDTFFESVRVTPLINTAGTIINTTVDGTAQGTISIADYEYHTFTYVGTIANTGTVFIYALQTGQTNLVLGSYITGSVNAANFTWELKTDAINAALAGGTGGTAYSNLGALVKVDASGTWRGVAAWYSHQPRSAGTTPLALGWGSVGTTLY